MNKMARYKGKIFGLAAMLICTVILIVVAATLKKNKSDDADNRVSSGTVSSDNKSYTAYDFAMGTSLSMTVYGDMKGSGSEKAEEECKKAFNLIKELDEEVISWRSSESVVSKLNRDGKMKFSDGNEVLLDVLLISSTLCKDSGGALDITIRPLADAWGIEEFDDKPEEFTIPSEEELLDAKEKTGYDKIIINMADLISGRLENASLVVELGGTTVDLGAVGKGFALDYVYNELIDVNDIVLSVGGSILVYGSGNKSKDFKIGIRDPEGGMNDMIGTLTLPSDCGKVCISTSGSYEKYIDKEGVRYHHIINPATMRPADSGLVSVTVVCNKDSLYPEYSGLISDGLSTACFILGREGSEELLKNYKAEAVFIDTEGNITTTDGLRDIFKNE